MTDSEALGRISAIDAMFDSAAGWSSWMVSCANEREHAVNLLNARGYDIKHKWLARTSDGGRTS